MQIHLRFAVNIDGLNWPAGQYEVADPYWASRLAAFSILPSDRTIATASRRNPQGAAMCFQYPTLGSNHRYRIPSADNTFPTRPFSILPSDRTIATD